MKKLLILATAILGIANYAFAFDVGSDEAATPITSVPYTISSPGIYYLAKNIFTNANAKITITASSVVLDLGGHTLQASATDACVLVSGGHNVTVQNGTLINNVAGCIFLAGTSCVIDHVSATAAGQCTLFDISGANNRINNCIFVSGKPVSPQGPIGPHGPAPCTVFLLGCSDLFESNIVTSPTALAIESGNTGAAGSILGNALRNNVVRSPSFFSPAPSVSLDEFDVYIGNLFPGKPAGATNVTGGVHATE